MLFASAMHGWGFALEDFAALYAAAGQPAQPNNRTASHANIVAATTLSAAHAMTTRERGGALAMTAGSGDSLAFVYYQF